MAKGISREKEHHLESVQCEKGSLRHIQTMVGLLSQSVVVLQARQTKPSTATGQSMLELLDKPVWEMTPVYIESTCCGLFFA